VSGSHHNPQRYAETAYTAQRNSDVLADPLLYGQHLDNDSIDAELRGAADTPE